MPVLTPHLALSTQTARHKMPDGAARAATLTDRISLAVAWALKSCDLPREEVARRMSAHLGQVVSVNILHGYAAQSKLDHRITLERFMALIDATDLPELLDFVTQPFGVAAVPAPLAELIELDLIEAQLSAVRDRRAEVITLQGIAS